MTIVCVDWTTWVSESMLLDRMTVCAHHLMRARERSHVFGTFPRWLAPQRNDR